MNTIKISYLCPLLLLCCLAACPLRAQDHKEAIVFDHTLYDFGDFKQSDGRKSHVFTFTNKGDKPVIIQTVISSCGCTSSSWTKQPVPPGKSGTVTAVFLNNQGPYPFDKSLSVYTNISQSPHILRIRGTVHAKRIDIGQTHPVNYSGVRMRKNVFELGQVPQGTRKTDSTDILNNTKTTLRLRIENLSDLGDIVLHPSVLAPGAKGRLLYTIDATRGEQWGNVRGSSRLYVNGKATGEALTVKGNITLNTRNMTKEEKASAPIPVLSNSAFNFYTVDKGSPVKTLFTLANKGRKTLKIYKIDYSHTGIKADLPMEIASDSSGIIKISIERPEDSGEVIYSISLITNAPSRPLINLLVYGTFSD